MIRVVVHKRAKRYLERMSRPDRERIRSALQRLSEDMANYPGVIAMAGDWSGYRRIRVGDFQVIFWYDEDENIIYVDHIGPRGDVYHP